MPDAILFDMDDTIVLWEIPVQKVWESAIQRFSGELGGLKPEDLYKAIRDAGNWYWSAPERHRSGRLNLPEARRQIGRMAFGQLGRKDLDLAERIANTYSVEREQCSSIAPGTIEFLKDLRRQGMKLGMITNGASDTQRAKIERYNLAPLFDNILIEGEFECGKPDERVFRHTLEKLKVKPSAAWMVGDNLEYDIAPCRDLGIYSLWVNDKGAGGVSLDGIRPDRIVRSILEIRDLLN